MQRRRIRVSGIVQGVGFRPFVYREATRLGLRGWVRNDDRGVLIEAQGDAAALDALTSVLVADPPPLARVREVRAETIPAGDEADFAIVASTRGSAPAVPVAPDSATCEACLAEVDDPADRRYRYPFTNCTNCGPRYTIVRRVPYDRRNTTMAGFVMCAACQAEYDDPADRRFHAQPNACAACGPRLRFGDRIGDPALRAAVDALRSGGIVAVKGLGGFHLACDATSDAAVDALRRRKHRDDKPFAVMATADQADALCDWTDAARVALHSPRRPIVLAPRRAEATIAAGVAPGLPDLGVLLAYTPLHHLLLAGVGRPLVMTSGNVSDEPIAHDDADAAARLGPLVDGVLGHDRPIHVRADDSVVRGATVVRRSRGYAPEPIPLHAHAPGTILAVGGELKNTVAVTVGDHVVVSHHIGDLEHLANHTAFRQAIEHLCALYDVTPDIVAHDLHPEYLSTKFAHDLDLPLVGVQHHHAHVAACLVDNACDGPVLGIAFDGLGYGADGTLWGGEFLLADRADFTRVGHLAPVALPGGGNAIREPWRMAVAWAQAAGVADGMRDPRRDDVARLAAADATPTTTSAGRLFDAVAALLGIRTVATYEGQAAIELEAAARRVSSPPTDRTGPVQHRYPVLDRTSSEEGVRALDPRPLIAAIVADRDRGVPTEVIAAAFHHSLGHAVADVAASLALANDVATVVLTGGVFQNVLLHTTVAEALTDAGLHVLAHRDVPPNDGGLCVGQAAVAASRLSR